MSLKTIQTCERCQRERELGGTSGIGIANVGYGGWREVSLYNDRKVTLCATCLRKVFDFIEKGTS